MYHFHPELSSALKVPGVGVLDIIRPGRRAAALVNETAAVGKVLDAATTTGPRFDVDIDSGVLYGIPTLDDWIFNRMKITRAEALRVPAVKRARDLICGEIGQFRLQMFDATGTPVDWSLLSQTEAGVARSVTWTRVVEDMLFDERAWLQTTHVGWHGKPAEVVRLDADTVTVQPELVRNRWGTATVWPQIDGLIRIDSPNSGLLSSPAIKACIVLDRATLNYVDGAPPIDYFTSDSDVDPFEDDAEAQQFLDDWAKVRRERGTGYVPVGIKYNVGGWDPEKLQLAEARTFAITEVARLTGVDAEELSVSTTSRTYANMQDRRRQRLESVLGPYMAAIEDRLSMDDITPRGMRVAFDTTGYLRLDDLSAATVDKTLIDAGVITRDEARTKRDLKPLPAGDTADPPAPADETSTEQEQAR